MYKYTTFDGVDLPTQNPDATVGAGEIDKAIFLELPGGAMYDAQGSDPAPTRAGVLTVKGSLSILGQTPAALETQERALRALLGVSGDLYRKWESSTNQELIKARLIGYNAQRRMENINYIDVALAFQLLWPSWDGTSHSDTTSLTGAPTTFNQLNNGNAPTSRVVVTITAAGSNITYVGIQRAFGGTTYNHLEWSGTLVVGQQLVLDCGARSIKNNGAAAFDGLSFGIQHRHSKWLQLDPGTNGISVYNTGGSSSSTIKFDYKDAHK